MQDSDISTPESLDTRIAMSRMRKQADLWRAAEGQLRWTELLGLVASLLLVVTGLYEVLQDRSLSGFMGGGVGYLLLGFAMLASFLWSSTQRQLAALRELVRRLEQQR